ncbi:MAG: hypothetical protein ACRDLF_01735, partial [Solirubrobacteraceae bacterium]
RKTSTAAGSPVRARPSRRSRSTQRAQRPSVWFFSSAPQPRQVCRTRSPAQRSHTPGAAAEGRASRSQAEHAIFDCSLRCRQPEHSGPAPVRAATIASVPQNAHGSRREGCLREQERQIGCSVRV